MTWLTQAGSYVKGPEFLRQRRLPEVDGPRTPGRVNANCVKSRHSTGGLTYILRELSNFRIHLLRELAARTILQVPTYYTILYYTILYYTILYYVLYYTVLYYTILCTTKHIYYTIYYILYIIYYMQYTIYYTILYYIHYSIA